jgi:hypothetical protein
MKIKTTILFLSVLLLSCQSKQAEKTTANTSYGANTKSQTTDALSGNFKFSMYISATGLGEAPPDSWTIDTSGIINIHTSHRMSGGKFQELNAMASLDQQDMDSLRMLIRKGKLYAIDSSDLGQQCAGDEHYNVKIVPLAATPALSASFDACAADYNLLLEPQRRYFRNFLDWWKRMRVKYRPNPMG